MIYRSIPAGDLQLNEDQTDIVLVDGLTYARQKIASRFKFFLAEWFLDQREGVPYFRDIFVQNPDMNVVRSVFRDVLLSVKGSDGSPLVSSITKFDLVFTAKTRRLAFDFGVVLNSNELLSVPLTDDLFIIDTTSLGLAA